MISRHRLRLACGGLDIICASCYGVVKGGGKVPSLQAIDAARVADLSGEELHHLMDILMEEKTDE